MDTDFDALTPVNARTHGFHYEGADDLGIPLLQDAWIEAIADRRLSTMPNGTLNGDAVSLAGAPQEDVHEEAEFSIERFNEH